MVVRLAIFDFDCTLTVIHVYRALAGETSGVPPPHAKTERGQLARLIELDAQGFIASAFGGPGRIAQLRTFFNELRHSGVECMVATRGLVAPVQQCLEKAGLLAYFTRVYGNLGDGYGQTPYDAQVAARGMPDLRKPGAYDLSTFGSKGQLVAHLLAERHLSSSHAVFVDDDPSEIADASSVCAVVQVQARHGVGMSEIQQVLTLAKVGQQRSHSTPPSGAPLAASYGAMPASFYAPSSLPQWQGGSYVPPAGAPAASWSQHPMYTGHTGYVTPAWGQTTADLASADEAPKRRQSRGKVQLDGDESSSEAGLCCQM